MNWGWVAWVTIGAAAGVLALAFAAQGHIKRPLGVVARTACFVAGVSLMFPDLIDDWVGGAVAARLIGIAILGLVIAYETVQARRTGPARPAG
jgi:TRAP-type uncharacterized transport system fused permease subunit